MATNNSWNNSIADSIGVIILNSGTDTISVSTDASNTTVNLATGAAVKAVTLGSNNTTSATTIDCGTNGCSVGATANVHTTTVGSITGAAATTLQSGTGALNVTSTNGALTINSGTGALAISNDASNTTVNLATGAAVKAVTLGSNNTSSSTAIKYGTGDLIASSASGTVINAHSSGVVNFPLQPAFLSNVNATLTNVTGDSTIYTVIFDAVSFDITSNYNNSTGVYTTPANGIYRFSASVSLSSASLIVTNSFIRLKVTDPFSTYYFWGMTLPGALSGSNNFITLQVNSSVALPANSAVSVEVCATGGAKNIGVYGPTGGTTFWSYFCGEMIS